MGFWRNLWEVFTVGYAVSNLPIARCVCCLSTGPTTCLPHLGKKRFCLTCAKGIMDEVEATP